MWRRKNNQRGRRRFRRNNTNGRAGLVGNSSNIITPLTKIVHLNAFVGESFTNVSVCSIQLNIASLTDISPSFATLPIGFEQWMAFYDQYTVLSCSTRVDLINNSTDQLVAAVYPSRSIDTIVAVAQASMLPESRTVNLAPGTGYKPVRINKSWNISRLLGRQRSDLDYVGTLSTSPVEPYYVNIACNSADIQVLVTDLTIRVTLKFKIKLFNRVLLGLQSSLPFPQAMTRQKNFYESCLPKLNNSIIVPKSKVIKLSKAKTPSSESKQTTLEDYIQLHKNQNHNNNNNDHLYEDY